MDTLLVKVLAGAALWAISVCLGVIVPYFLWKIHPSRPNSQGRPLLEDSGDNSEHETYQTESENLMSGRPRTQKSNCCEFCFKTLKRIASCLRVRLSNHRFLSLINCVCGGVFLGVSLLDLIPQTRQAIDDVLEAEDLQTKFPVAEFGISLGLLLVMVIENVVTELMLPKRRDSPHSRTTSINNEEGHRAAVTWEDARDLVQKIAIYRMFVLVITLSLHSVFEGLAIGLQDSIATLVQLVIAISVHKAVLSFTVGLRLFETFGRTGKIGRAIFCALIFCTSSPAGCIIGAFVSRDPSESTSSAFIASALLQCLAAGTFLYVTFVEVIPLEFSHSSESHCEQSQSNSTGPSNSEGRRVNSEMHTVSQPKRKPSQLLKLLALILGYSIACGLQFL